jgi:hypothetical protein
MGARPSRFLTGPPAKRRAMRRTPVAGRVRLKQMTGDEHRFASRGKLFGNFRKLSSEGDLSNNYGRGSTQFQIAWVRL